MQARSEDAWPAVSPKAAMPVPTEYSPRTLANLAVAVRLADAAILYDPRDVTPGTHTAVAICKRDWVQEKVSSLPEWAQSVLSGAGMG
jgi:hypothetical protein